MSAKTKIEWTNRTWNPVRGCSLVSAGCTHCYAMKQAHRFSGPGGAYEGLTRLGPNGPVWTGKIKLVEDALLEPLRWRKSCHIFVNSMSDLFHEDVPDSFIAKIIGIIGFVGAYRGHRFQVLTKRSKRMRSLLSDPKFSAHAAEAAKKDWISAAMPNNWDWKWPLPNLHLYVSVEDQATAEARIPDLLATPAAVRGISLEPMLGAVRMDGWLRGKPSHGPWLDHVILGGESGPGARPMHPDWVRKVRYDCRAAGVPFFFKQWGEWGVCNRGDRGAHWIYAAGLREKQTGHDPSFKGGEAAVLMARIGKKRAGRVLDGRTWDQMPGEG